MNQPHKAAFATFIATILLGALTAPVWADEAGKKAFLTEKCDQCHSIKTHEIERTIASEKMWGPDLSGVGLTRDAEWMEKFTLKEVELDGKNHKNTFKGTKKSLATITAWLAEQKAAAD